jgi:mRNA interferase RelE/StbE
MARQIEITPTSLEALGAIANRRTRSVIVKRIDALAEELQRKGKPLRGWLVGFYSARAAGQRYRVVYKIDDARKRVLVYMVGMRREGSRRDVYALAEHLVQRGLV